MCTAGVGISLFSLSFLSPFSYYHVLFRAMLGSTTLANSVAQLKPRLLWNGEVVSQLVEFICDNWDDPVDVSVVSRLVELFLCQEKLLLHLWCVCVWMAVGKACGSVTSMPLFDVVQWDKRSIWKNLPGSTTSTMRHPFPFFWIASKDYVYVAELY